MRTSILGLVFALVLAGFAVGGERQEGASDTPVFDEYYRLSREIETLGKNDTPVVREKRAVLRKKLGALRKALREEIGTRNAKIYEARQAELVCRARPEIPAGRKLGFALHDYPLVNGSTSTHPLGVLVACRLLGVDYTWTNRYHRPTSNRGIRASDAYWFEMSDYLVQYRLLATGESRFAERTAAFVNKQIVIHNGTHGGYVALTEKRSDLALLARRPSSKETKSAAGKGITFDVRPVALDAFVFVTHRSNPVRSLTTGQLKGIYSGQVGNWTEVGGHAAGIDAYQRNETSGSQQLMLSAFMGKTPILKSRNRLLRASMGGPYSALTENQNGIAYSVYFYEHFMAASPYTRALAVDGVEPTAETIRKKTYPYTTEVYVVIRKSEPAVSHARKLRDWLLTEEGQAVVSESGYVPLPTD